MIWSGFYPEARRVARTGAVLAVCCYGVCQLRAAHGNAELQHYYSNVVGPYWAPERLLVESGYRTLAFPVPELQPPTLTMQLDWTLEQLLGYASSWSASARYFKERGVDPVQLLRSALRPHWGEVTVRHTVQWPVSLRAARIRT